MAEAVCRSRLVRGTGLYFRIHPTIYTASLTPPALPRLGGHLAVGRTGGTLGHQDAVGAMRGRRQAHTPAR